MSDHISGPRALADPIADITDVYAFPSPERPGHLVLVQNTLPFAPATARFSDGLVYRFRLREVHLVEAAHRSVAVRRPRLAGARVRLSCSPSQPSTEPQEGTCHTPSGETVAFGVGDEQGGTGHGVRAFAGVRWDPFIMDAPAALKTIATEKLAFTDPGSIYMDGKNVLSIVLEIDCARYLPGVELVGHRLRDADARQVQRPHRARRPARGQEPVARAEAVRPGQPRSRDPRHLQHGGRLSPGRRLRRRVPSPAERESALLGRPRR